MTIVPLRSDSEAALNAKSPAHRLATGIKFLLLGLPGGMLFVGGTMLATGELLFELRHPHPNTFKDILVGTAAAIVGFPALMYGVDKWGQWRYGFVFISIPLSIWMVSVVVSDKAGVLLAVFPTLIVYRIVKNSYENAA